MSHFVMKKTRRRRKFTSTTVALYFIIWKSRGFFKCKKL